MAHGRVYEMIIMAEKKAEKVFTIPLRDAFNTQRTRRARKSIALVREFLEKHMKVEKKKIRLGASINTAIWARGMQKPPRKLKVHATKNEEGIVFAEIVGVELKTPTKEELKKKAEKIAEKKKKLKEERKERKQKPVEEEAKEEKAEKEKAAGRERPVEEKKEKKPAEEKK